MHIISPLRYPGGKGKLGPYFARIIADQTIVVDTYAEPYAGGAGAGLFLLSEGHINRLLINDLNPGIAAFWRSILSTPHDFVDRISSVDVSIDTWHEARKVYLSPTGHSDLDLGFATFFLNRCNRSGILTARPIGGLEQTGKWKIDARFNRENLANRILYVAKMASQITVTQQTALQFIANVSRRKSPVFLYADPPYVDKGEDLYMSSHTWPAHQKLAKSLSRTGHPWILTYDVDARIRDLYSGCRCLRYSISHTAQAQKVGREYMFFSPNLRVSDVVVASGRSGEWID